MPTCPNDGTEMVSTSKKTTDRCCTECGYAE